MGRPRKNPESTVTEEKIPAQTEETVGKFDSLNELTEENIEDQKESEPVTEEKIPANVENLMRLNPQYKEFWVTPKGFVHPVTAPKYLLKDAKLYQNKFYNH